MKFTKRLLSLLLAAFWGTVGVAQQSPLKITADYPGGNIIVEKIVGDTVWLQQDLRDTKGYWFYWNFKISGVSGRTIYFRFRDKPVFTLFGPAYSLNNDFSWSWLGEMSHTDTSFSFTFSKKDTLALFSMGIPYTQKNLTQFLSSVQNRQRLRLDTLCFSERGRAVERMMIKPDHKAKYRVLISARNHACEAMANYEMEGLIDAILNEVNLQYLRDYVEFMVVPFMDKDGVEDGDQGKNRQPRDHNRDYGEHSIYSSIRALKLAVNKWSEGKIRITLDLHCPYIRGDGNEIIYVVGEKDPEMSKKQVLFSDLLEKNNRGELKFYSRDFVAYGTSWNTDKNYTQGMSFSEWGTSVPGNSLSTTIEFPYAMVSGVMVTKDNARAFGKTVAYAIMDYLKGLKEK